MLSRKRSAAGAADDEEEEDFHEQARVRHNDSAPTAIPSFRMYSRRRSTAKKGRVPYATYKRMQRADYLMNRQRKGGFQFVPSSEAGVARFGKTYRSADPAQKAQRMLDQYYGHGSYSQPMYTGHGGYGQDIGRALGRLGSKLAPIPGIQGGKFGGWLGNLITGGGDYSMVAAQDSEPHANNLMNGHAMGQPPKIVTHADETGSIEIVHREYLTDLFGPAAGNGFQNQSYPLNPALQQSFPWLSQLAGNYDEYEFLQLMFEFRSTTTDIGTSTTGQVGTIIMSTNYNAASLPFQDKASMMEYAHSASCKTTEHMRHFVECDRHKVALSSQLYTRSNPVLTGEDVKTYDHGLFQVGLANSPAGFAGLPIGELWVSYKVMLRKPKLFVARGLEIDRDSFYTSTNLDSTVEPSTPFGTANTTKYLRGQQNNIGCAIFPGQALAYSGTTSPAQTVTTTSTALFILFPAQFAGNLRITIRCTTAGTFTGNCSFAVTRLGNVQPIFDQYAAGTIGGSAAVGPLSSHSIQSSNVWQGTFDCFVSAASALAYNASTTNPATGNSYYGGSNGVSIDFGGIVGDGNIVNASLLTIEQYQSSGGAQGLAKADDKMVWINSSKVATVPI